MPPIELTLLNALCQLAGRIGWSSATYPSLCEVRGEISSSSRSYHCFHRRSLAPSFLDMTSSPLPSPLTSLTPPTTATTRIRIKPPRRPGSLSIPRTRSMSAPTVVTTDPDTPASDIRSNALAGAVGRRQSHKSPITPLPRLPRQVGDPNRTELSCLAWTAWRTERRTCQRGQVSPWAHAHLLLVSRESLSSLDGAGAREREPLTLVER